jgi:hypothetical protein
LSPQRRAKQKAAPKRGGSLLAQFHIDALADLAGSDQVVEVDITRCAIREVVNLGIGARAGVRPPLIDLIRRREAHLAIRAPRVPQRDMLLINALHRGEVALAFFLELVGFLKVDVVLEFVARGIAAIPDAGF